MDEQAAHCPLLQRHHRVLYIESLGLRPSRRWQDRQRIVKRLRRMFRPPRQVSRLVGLVAHGDPRRDAGGAADQSIVVEAPGLDSRESSLSTVGTNPLTGRYLNLNAARIISRRCSLPLFITVLTAFMPSQACLPR